MGELLQMTPELVHDDGSRVRVDNTGGGGNDGGMDRERIARIEAIIPTLATKADLQELRGDMKSQMQELRADFHKSQHEMMKWFLGVAIALGAVLVSLGSVAVNYITKS